MLLGPRIFLLGWRLHEFHVGFLMLAAITVARLAGLLSSGQVFYALIFAGA